MGKLVILTGKSGAGKDTVYKELAEMKFDTSSFVSTTTRPMRDNEQEGVDYYFVSEDKFKEKINNNEFLEYRSYNAKNNGKDVVWYYGSPKIELDSNKDYAVVLDMQGAKAYTEHFGKENCFVVYLDVTDEIREERAVKRGSFDKEEFERRKADDDIKFSKEIIDNIANFVINNSYNDAETTAYEISEALEKYEKGVKKFKENGDSELDLLVIQNTEYGYMSPPETSYECFDRKGYMEYIENEKQEMRKGQQEYKKNQNHIERE